jgi:hypothetical protein
MLASISLRNSWDVDDYWILSQQMGVQVIRPLENRSYGLRDFTIAGPDGLGLRFATRLSDLESSPTSEGPGNLYSDG